MFCSFLTENASNVLPSLEHPHQPGVTSWRKRPKLKEGRGHFVFHRVPETADGRTSPVYASTHMPEQMVWPYANVLACGHALCAQQSKRLKTTSDHLCFEEKNICLTAFCTSPLNATRHQCWVMSQTDPLLVSAALSIKTWCALSLHCKCLRTS